MGGTIAILAAAKRPDLFATVTGVGMDILGAENENFAYEFALSEARRRSHKKALRLLEKLGPPPHSDPGHFLARVRWVTDFGGVQRGETFNTIFLTTLKLLWRCPQYSLLDVIRTFWGMQTCQKQIVPDMIRWNLFERVQKLEIPVHLFQGRLDRAVNPETAKRYWEELKANGSVASFTEFGNSAHMPHLEEPERMRNMLLQATDVS